MKTKPVTLGTVSHGTLLARDLIAAFADALRSLRGSLPKAIYSDMRALCGNFDSVEAHDVVDALADALNEYAPDYCYFGTHIGDGSDYGFWVREDWEQLARDDDALFVSDTSEVPADYRGLVVHVNDHGNATLYGAGLKLVIWSVV